MGKLSYDLGKQGEDFAADYLEQQGYQIIERNFHSSHGEIDIVATQGVFLVFIEVKNYSYRSFGLPVYAVNRDKKSSLIHAAKTYLYKRNIKDRFCRFDVLTVYRNESGEKSIELYKDAFQIRRL